MKAKCNNCTQDCRRRKLNPQANNGHISGMFHKGKLVMYADVPAPVMQACNVHRAPFSRFSLMEALQSVFTIVSY